MIMGVVVGKFYDSESKAREFVKENPDYVMVKKTKDKVIYVVIHKSQL